MADKYLSDEEVFGPGAGAGSGYLSDEEVFGPPKNRSYLGAALESGVRTLGAAGATVLDAINPFTTSEEDAAKLYKDDPEGFKRFQEESAAAVLQRFAAEQTKRSREVMQEVSPDETGAVSGAPLGELEYATLDPEKAAYLSPTRVAGDVLQSLPSTLALAVSGYFTRGKSLQAYEQALARETAKGVTKAEAQAIAKAEAVREGAKSMAVIGGSSEGVVTGAQQYNQALDQVGELDQAKIEQSPEYQALLDEGYAPETARATLANRVATQSGVTSGVTTGLISAAGGRYLGGLVGEGGSLLPRVGKGFLIEGATEAPQSTLEQINQNVAMRRIDPSQDILEGAGEAAAAGFVVGGVTGGAFGAAFGGGDASRQRQRVAEQDLREAPDAASAAAAANELAGSVDELTSAIDEYLTPTGEIPTPEQAAATPAPQDTALREDPTRSMIDRQAGLIAQAQAAGTQFDRQMALDQAQAALPQPEEGRAAGFVDLTPMNEMQAQQRLAVLRDQTAQAGGNALGLAIVPHPAQADRFAIVEQALPDLSLPQAETTIAPDQAQFQIESAALGGQVNQARAEDSATRGPVIDQALKAVEARGGVASPAEARIFQEAGIGQPYDRVDPALGPEPAPLIEIAGAARESFTPNQQIAAQEVQADQAARRESDIAQRDRTTEQQIAAAGQARQAPDAGAVISALVTPGAQRSAEQVRVVNEARNRFSPADFSILERAATAPFQLNTEERMRLRELRNPSVSETNTNVSETSTGLMGTRVAERLGQPSGGRIVTTNAKLSSQRVAPGGTVTINDGETQHEARVVENGRLGVQGRLLQQIARLFNKRLVTFESDTLQADGFVMDGDNDSIYINAQSQMSVLAVFGHELTHLLKRDNPEAYAALEAVVRRELREGATSEFEQDTGYDADTSLEELTSDLVGNRFQEPDFWQSVFDEIAAQNPEGARGIIARLAAAINRAINAFRKFVTQPGFDSDQYVNDINAVKRAVNQAMTAYMQQPRLGAEQSTEQAVAEVTREIRAAGKPSMAERLREAARGARTEMGETITASKARRQQARVMFEVAPDPDNTALKEQWDALPAERKAEISQRVAARVMPRVFDILGIKRTRVLDQMGGYLEDTNPSFAAVFTSTTEAADVLEAAKVTGFALHQQSMMVLSGEPFAGSFETGLITVTLPEGKTDQESVHQVYRQLRALNPDAVQGHTTVEREMVLAVPKNVLASLTQQVENALSAEYSVRKTVGHMAFPEKKDYDYASQKRTGRSAELLARRPEILRLREETDAAIQDELATYEVETQGAPGRQVGTPRSTVDLMTINPVRARAALGLKPNPVSGDGNGVRQIGEALNNATLNQHGRISDTDTSPEAQDMLAQAMADEVQYQLRTTSETGSGLGWYSNNYPRAVKKLARVFPELKTSKAARAMFTAAVAITSNGEKVSLNINNAIRLYKNYRETGSFLGANVGSRRAAALDANVIALDRLVQEMGPLAAARHLMGEMTVGQINADLRKRGEKPDSSYTATTVMPRAALYFGPKLGAFYANLMGSEGYLTMDLWWSRTINRMRGVLVPRATDSSIDNLRDLLGQPDLSRDQVVSASIGPRNAYEGRNFQTELEQLVGEKEPNTNAGSERWMAKARAAAGARFDEMLRQQRIEKTANTIYKNEFEGLEEAPFRASDRAFMYGAARRAQEILEQRLGQKLSIADIQAALWYYEKRLYAKLSGRKADDIGYEEAILQHAESDRPERSSARFDRESDGGNDAGREGRVLDRPGQEDRPADQAQLSRRRNPQVDTPEFQRFFGDSKVVDENGDPLVVYHGTNADFSEFDQEQRGKATGARSAKLGFFFASNPAVASTYADTLNGYKDTAIGRLLTRLTRGAYERFNEAILKPFGTSAIRTGGNVMPLYLSIENPLVVDFQGREYRETSYAEIIAKAKEAGHDGVILRRTFDEGFTDGGNEMTDVYVAFRPEQIKSATGNIGTFDPTKADITLSRQRDLSAAANEIAAMDSEVRDNTEIGDFPGAAAGYDLYEARQMLKKPSDKLKRITENNSFSLWQSQDYIANVDGDLFGVTKQEDPDDLDDDTKFVYAFQRLDDPDQKLVTTSTDQVDELFKEMRASKGDAQLSRRRNPQVDTPEFKRWFGDSKVVDQNGDPLVLYHGTAYDFSEFSPERLGSNTGAPSAEVGFFFTARPKTAEYYAKGQFPNLESAAKAKERLVVDITRVKWDTPTGKWKEGANLVTVERTAEGTTPNIMPVYLSLQNPLTYDFKNKVYRDKKYWELIDQAKKEGRDGVILKNTYDSGEYSRFDAIIRGRFKGEDIYIVFEPTQIKSAIGNIGTFDPTKANITQSRRRNYGTLTAAQEQALRNVGGIVPEQTAGDRMKELGGKFQRSWFSGIFDQFAPLKDVDQRAYMLARLSKGSDGALEALMLYGKPFMNGDVPDVNVNDQGFINVMATLKGEHDRFLWWVAAQRAENIKANAQKAQARIATIDSSLAQLRQAKKAATAAVDYRKIEQDISTLEAERSRLKNTGQENLFTDQDISSLKSLNQGNFEDGTPRGQAYANALVKMNEFNDAVLNIAEQSGLIDGQARQLFKDMPYVPFYRVMEDGVDGPSFSSGLVNQQAWKKLKGGTQKLNEDLLSNVLLNWAHLFDAAGKNRAGVASLQAATQIGIAQKVPAGTKGAVKVMEQGQTQHYTIDDPYIMEAVTALNYQPPGFFAPFSTFKKWLTIGVTASPTFKIKNLMRDSLQAIGTAPMSYNVASNVMKGFKQGSQETQTFASMLAGGGLIRFGSMIEGTNRTNYMIERQGGILLNEGGWKKLQRQMTGLVEAYAELGDRLENVNRVSLYEHLISKGYSQAEANFMSRDLMDFSLQGRWPVVRFLAQSVPFLNARLQGLSKLGRGAKDDTRRFGYVVGAVAMASIALMLAYEDDEDWKKRPDWDRDSNWWFKIGDTAFRIPKPFEIGAIGTVAERTWEVAFNDDMSWKRYRQRLSHMIFETFAMDPTPQLVVPISEIYANKEGFTQRPIEGLGLQKLRPEDRATERTSSVARLLGQMGLPSPVSLVKGDYEKLSPVQIDHLIRGYFGWIGTTATTILDFGLRPFMDRGERPAYRLKDVFVAGNFAEGLPANSSRYVDQLYEQSRIIEQAYMSYRDAKKKGDREKVRELLADEGDKIKAYKSINKISQQVSDINRKIRQIESSKTLSADTKRKMIDKLSERKDKVAKRAQKFAKID
jgi:hypothetical protein